MMDQLESDLTYIKNLWQSLLEVEVIENHDDFYIVGGNSMLAVKMLAKVVRERDCDVDFDSFFDDPTPQSLCSSISRNSLR